MESRRNRNFGVAGSSTDEHHLEGLNQSMAETLSSKVGQLKSLAIDLDTESKDHLPLLDDVNDDMELGSMRMTASSSRIRSVAGGGSRSRGGILGRCGLSFYVAVGVTCFLLFVYYVLLRQKP